MTAKNENIRLTQKIDDLSSAIKLQYNEQQEQGRILARIDEYLRNNTTNINRLQNEIKETKDEVEAIRVDYSELKGKLWVYMVSIPAIVGGISAIALKVLFGA